MNALFELLGRAVVRFRYVVVAVWIAGTVAAVAGLPSLGSQIDNNNGAFLPADAPSNVAARLAQPVAGSVAASQVPVIAVTARARLDPGDRADLARAARQLSRVPTVRSVRFVAESADGRASELLVVSSVSPFDQGRAGTLVDGLQAALGRSALPAHLKAHLAGRVATNVANQKQSQRTGKLVQAFSVLLILLLLLVIFRAVLAPLVTLLPAVIVLLLSGAFIGGLGSVGLRISAITQLLLIVLVLGAGTDYGLFLVFRVREELLRGRPPADAVRTAVLRVGESIAASAATVMVALLSLLLARFGLYHDLGVPLAIGIAVMLLAGLTLLPALLAILGPAVFWPSKTAPREAHDGMWGRVAGRLVRRPARTLGIGVLCFAGVALAALGYHAGGFGGGLTAPAGSGAARGDAAMARHFPESSQNPTTVVMRFSQPLWPDPSRIATATRALLGSGRFVTLAGPLDPNGGVLTPADLQRLHSRLGPALGLGPVEPAGVEVAPAMYAAYVATGRYLSADGRTVVWQAGLRAGDPGTTDALRAVPGIRAMVERVSRQVGATAAGIAGQAPALRDVSTTSDRDLGRIVPLAVAAIALVLGLVLRSLVAPLYLIVSVVLSYLAALGLAVIVLIGFGGQGGITFVLPFLMFVFLLALGEDYNILVMTRIREEADRRPLPDAVVRAVGVTGPTVTSAGLVLAGTFAVLAVGGGGGGGGSQARTIGFGLAVGILLDTFVVRTVLVPSAVALLGRWNWWPSSMGRRGPRPATPADGPAVPPEARRAGRSPR
jgi:RND superfamily putative drug exporter